MTPTVLANHVWQSTLVAAAAWLLTLALRRNPAGARYGVWLAASLKFLVPFAVLVSAGNLIGWRTMPIAEETPMAFAINIFGQPFSPPPDTGTPVLPAAGALATAGATWPVPISLLTVWLAGAAVMLIVWLVRWRRVAAIVRAGDRVEDGPVFDAMRRVEARNDTIRPLTLVVSDTSIEPGVFGILKPVLLWPRPIAAHLSEAQIESIVAHEMAHVRRRDNLAAAAHMIVQAIFWFHPMVWWLGARLVDERERACDEEVVRHGGDPRTYAESILKTCRFFVESPLACVAGVTGSDLKKRIEHIMVDDPRAALNGWKKMLLAAAAGAAILGPVAVGVLNPAPLRAQPAQAEGTSAAFDVTSVKPNDSGSGQIGMFAAPGGGWRATNVTLGMLIRIAHQLQDNQIVGGPKWMFSDRFDVVGSGAAPGRDGAMPAKLKTLLADRFGLVTHTEKRELPMYKLSFNRADRKLGPKIQRATVDCPAPPSPLGRGGQPPAGPMSPAQMQRCGMTIGPGRFAGGSVSMAQLAASLSRIVGSMVVDATNLDGSFELTLEYAPDPNMGGRSDFQGLPPPLAGERPASEGPSIFSALQEQLGLKLEGTRAPVDVLVIDSAEKPTPD